MLYSSSETLHHGTPFALQELSLEDDPLLLRGLAKQGLVGVPGRALVVVYVDNGLVYQFSRGEYSTDISPSAAVNPVAVKTLHVISQRKHNRTLRLELDHNPCRTSFKSVTVLHESGWRKTMISEVWHVRNIRQRYFHETVSGSEGNVNIAKCFDRAG